MLFKAYFRVYPGITQDSIFFFSQPPSGDISGMKTYCAEIEVPDFDAKIPRAVVNSVEEMLSDKIVA